ncbi:uncharacterized protein BT62DRAFT_1014324 [Guyanagaster necrorhizus]|uniref:Uncharacterized protein n=1 Tax=Guyanagaster necrorhizus TaxID=856835 RepID=A0A9P8AKW6_9AGAR|nr:uncharacterized protein BT62DRAFT_1014324 [Guyanagaster necrorhizus MCA 3950]KAG7439130.1 hypothetical protein BT62DRAFT_1014324 [Guyanagaster necrorhizus MCA 3950]
MWLEHSITDVEGTSGGSAKIKLLNRYSAMPCFAIQHLNELLRELLDVFVIRYQSKCTTEEIQTHETWMIPYPDPTTELPAASYFMKMGKLENPTWLVETLRAHAEKMNVRRRGSYDWCYNACFSRDGC